MVPPRLVVLRAGVSAANGRFWTRDQRLWRS